MSRKRDYKAEEQRRNQLALERGFTTRGAERRAQQRKDYEIAGFKSHADYQKARQEAAAWSRSHSKKPASQYSPAFKPAQLKAYKNAYRIGKAKDKTAHGQYIHDLAEYLHSIDPDTYPDAESDFWTNY